MEALWLYITFVKAKEGAMFGLWENPHCPPGQDCFQATQPSEPKARAASSEKIKTVQIEKTTQDMRTTSLEPASSTKYNEAKGEMKYPKAVRSIARRVLRHGAVRC